MARHLTLYDFRDIDLMLAAEDAADELGQVSTENLADALGMDDDRKAVGSRMAWMRRYGVFEFDEQRKLWRLTRGGQRVIEAKRVAAAGDALDDVPDEAMVDVMAHVTQRYRRGDPVMATLLRREFLFGTKPQSAAYRQNGKRRRR